MIYPSNKETVENKTQVCINNNFQDLSSFMASMQKWMLLAKSVIRSKIFHIVQNFQGKGHRTQSLNMHYLVLFRNLRATLKHVKLTILQDKYIKTMLSIYKKCTGMLPHLHFSYLFVDLKQKTQENLRW